jgi:deoxyribose-phosphate aldolase
MDINEIVRQVTEEVYRRLEEQPQAAAATPGQENSPADMAKYIDHTILKPAASIEDVRKICDEAKKYKFASVCVNPSYIKFVADVLSGSGVAPCCVIGFPLGACTPEAKANEAGDAAINGAKEVDMVVNVGAIKSNDWALVKRDIEGVVNAVRGRAIVKVIIETCLLTDEEKVKACTVSKLAGAHFVKTSTGFSTGGATVADVKLMRQTVGDIMGVKASGGVKDYKTALAMIEAGANRLGTSSGVDIIMAKDTQTTSSCIHCGLCDKACPTGTVTIVKNAY